MAHKFAKGKWNPVKKPGSETARAKAHGRSLHAQAEVDEHSPNKRIRGKGIFALNAQRGAFKHKAGKRATAKARTRKEAAKRASGKRVRR